MTPTKARPKAPPRRGKAPKAPAPSTAPPDLPMPGTSAKHPPIGLGLWAMGRWSREDEARTRETIERALDLGVRWFDTAEVYGTGRSERLLGDALARRGDSAKGIFVSTKLSWEHLRPSMVRPALHGSLERLGLPKVDLYLLHAPDPRVPVRDTMGALAELYREGRLGAVGVSNFSAAEMEEARRAAGEMPLVANQIRFNLLERDEGEALAGPCRETGILLEAYTPLARGLLAGRYLDAERPDAHVRSFARDLFAQDRFPELRERARALHELAEGAGVPMASIALHALARRGVAPVFGASRPEQVDSTLAAWAVRPPEELLERAEAIARGDGA